MAAAKELWAEFDQQLTELSTRASPGVWWVALSGGRDSMVLLDLAHRWCQRHPGQILRAVHVNHGLHADAGDWTERCQEACDARAVALTIRRCNVDRRCSEGLEASARRARYQVFSELLEAQDVLLMAHHADDQAETVLFRLLRGSGAQGLSGIPRQRTVGKGLLFRPLLSVERAAIDLWAGAQGLVYVDDPSNNDTGLDRNFLRLEVLPLIASRWPGYVQALNRVATIQRQVIDELSMQPLPSGYSRFNEPLLNFTPAMTPEQLASALHRWLTLQGFVVSRQKRLLTFAQQVLSADQDRQPKLHTGSYVLCRWRRAVVCKPLGLEQTADSAAGRLEQSPAEPVLSVGRTISGPWGTLTWQPSPHAWGLPEGMALEVRYRGSGERLAPLNGCRRGFGQLCQERGIPPWWRDRLPLFTQSGDNRPLFAPALGNFAAIAEVPGAGKPLFIPIWRPPVVDRSIEPIPSNW